MFSDKKFFENFKFGTAISSIASDSTKKNVFGTENYFQKFELDGFPIILHYVEETIHFVKNTKIRILINLSSSV